MLAVNQRHWISHTVGPATAENVPMPDDLQGDIPNPSVAAQAGRFRSPRFRGRQSHGAFWGGALLKGLVAASPGGPMLCAAGSSPGWRSLAGCRCSARRTVLPCWPGSPPALVCQRQEQRYPPSDCRITVPSRSFRHQVRVLPVAAIHMCFILGALLIGLDRPVLVSKSALADGGDKKKQLIALCRESATICDKYGIGG